MHNLPTELLRTFVTVVEKEGFTAAGQAMGRTQPAVSLQMKRLEEICGTPLFDRVGKRQKISESGKLLLDYAHQILNLNDEVLRRLQAPKLAGTVKLGLPNEFAMTLLPNILGKFANSHPEVTLQVECDLSTHLLSRLQSQEFDLIVCIHDEAPNSDFEPLWTEDLVWVRSPIHATHEQTPLPLIVAPEGCVYRKQLSTRLKERGIESRIVYTSSGYSGIQAAVLAGLGVTVLARSTVPKGMRIVEESEHLPGLAGAQVGLHFASRKRSEAVQMLADYLSVGIGAVPSA